MGRPRGVARAAYPGALSRPEGGVPPARRNEPAAKARPADDVFSEEPKRRSHPPLHAERRSHRPAQTRAMVELIRSAQHSVRVNLTRLDVNSAVIHALAHAARKGLTVECYLGGYDPGRESYLALREELAKHDIDVLVDSTMRIPEGTVLADDARAICPVPGADPRQLRAMFDRAFSSAINTNGFGVGPEEVKVFMEPEAHAGGLLGELLAAKHSIEVSSYILDYPGMIDILKRKAAEGIPVRVMLEPHPVGGGNFEGVSHALRRDMPKDQMQVHRTPEEFSRGHAHDHAKWVRIDERMVIVSTGSFRRFSLGADPVAEADNRDFLAVDTRARTVEEAGRLFQADWLGQDAGKIDFQNLIVTPGDAKKQILKFIGAQKKRLYVWEQSLTDPDVVEALAKAKGKNVDVRVLLGLWPGRNGMPSNLGALRDLRTAEVGAEYFTRYTLHAKCMVGDEEALVLSQNATAGGLDFNREVGVRVDDLEQVESLAQYVLADERDPGRQPDLPGILPAGPVKLRKSANQGEEAEGG